MRQRIDLVVLAAEWKVAQFLEEGVVPAGSHNGEFRPSTWDATGIARVALAPVSREVATR